MRKFCEMKGLLFLLFLIVFGFSYAQSQDEAAESPVNWMTIEKADSLFKIQPKPMLVDVYTDWCGWCKVMMKKTFSNKNLAAYINQNFYPVRINAEKDDSIRYNGKLYVKNGKVNQLARELLNGRLAYPTIVYIDRQRRHYPIPGYYDVKKIQPILVYFAEGINDYENLQNFIIQYYYTYPEYYKDQIAELKENEKLDTSGIVNWTSFDKAFEQKEKKLYFMFAYVPWCYSCKTMQKTTFRNPVIAKIINENFIPVNFDLSTTENITVKGKVYKSLGNGQPHQLAMAIFNNRPYYPALVFLDENFNVISIVGGYFSAKSIEPVLKYFAEQKYKTTSYQDFIKNFKPEIK